MSKTDRLEAKAGRTSAQLRACAAAWPGRCCRRGCRQDMHDAPRYDPLEASPVFTNGASAQPLVAGTVARGQLNDDELLDTGKVNGQPPTCSRSRSRARISIAASSASTSTARRATAGPAKATAWSCSAATGRRRRTTSIACATAPAGYFFDVITNGFGAMPDYRAQIPVEDRWRIVAYIRALQLSHTRTTADVPAAELGTS